jgi:uncharacterized membrane protein YdfJ with MMPL/SSD domain
MMQSLGISCCCTLLITLLVNITLTPSLLLLFPNFFEGSVRPCNLGCCVCGWGAVDRGSVKNKYMSINNEKMFSEDSAVVDSSNQIVNPAVDTHLQSYKSQVMAESPIWYKIGNFSVRIPFNLILVGIILGITIPVSLYSFNYKVSDSLLMDLPNGASITETYELMLQQFGESRLNPYRLLLIPNEQIYSSTTYYGVTYGPVYSAEFLGNVTTVINQMVALLPNTTENDFQGIVYAMNRTMTVPTLDLCVFNNKSILYNNSLCDLVRSGAKQFVNKDQTATYLYLQLNFETLGPFGHNWYKEAVVLLRNLSVSIGIDATLSGVSATSMDAIDSADSSFIIMIGATAGLVLVGLGLSFRSILVPLRSVVSITLTILWVFGLADLVYEHHILDWLGFFGLKGWDALHWAPPLVSFSIVVGIALDYDIFLLVRISEYRDMGFPTKDAISLGIAKTGHIITAAGTIMAVAFSGLLFSSVAVANMLSFYMVFSVLYDTFLVRPLLVPSLMSLFGDWNWWPRKIPPAVQIK